MDGRLRYPPDGTVRAAGGDPTGVPAAVSEGQDGRSEPSGDSGDDAPLGLGLQYSIEERDGVKVLVGLFSPGPQHSGARGFLHGGVAATALDETMAGVGYALDRARTVTGTLTLRSRRPVPLSAGPLRIEAWRDKAEPRRSQRIHGRLLLADGTLAVEATGIFVRAALR